MSRALRASSIAAAVRPPWMSTLFLLLLAAFAATCGGAAVGAAGAVGQGPAPEAALRSYLEEMRSSNREKVAALQAAAAAAEALAPPLPTADPVWAAAPRCTAGPGVKSILLQLGERIRHHMEKVVVVVSLNTPMACAAVPRWWSIMRAAFCEVRFIVPSQYASEPECARLGDPSRALATVPMRQPCETPLTCCCD